MSVRRLTSVGCAVKTKLIFKFLAIWKKDFLGMESTNHNEVKLLRSQIVKFSYGVEKGQDLPLFFKGLGIENETS